MSSASAGIAIDTGGDGGESDGLELVFDGEGECRAVAAAKDGLVALVVLEDRPDGVDDLLAGQVVRVGDLRRAGEAAT